VNRHQHPSAEDNRSGHRLLGREHARLPADRLAPAEARAIDGKERGIERAELAANSPPVAMPLGIAAVEDAPPAGRDHPRNLRIPVTIRRRHRRGGEVAQQLGLPQRTGAGTRALRPR